MFYFDISVDIVQRKAPHSECKWIWNTKPMKNCLSLQNQSKNFFTAAVCPDLLRPNGSSKQKQNGNETESLENKNK